MWSHLRSLHLGLTPSNFLSLLLSLSHSLSLSLSLSLPFSPRTWAAVEVAGREREGYPGACVCVSTDRRTITQVYSTSILHLILYSYSASTPPPLLDNTLFVAIPWSLTSSLLSYLHPFTPFLYPHAPLLYPDTPLLYPHTPLFNPHCAPQYSSSLPPSPLHSLTADSVQESEGSCPVSHLLRWNWRTCWQKVIKVIYDYCYHGNYFSCILFCPI